MTVGVEPIAKTDVQEPGATALALVVLAAAYFLGAEAAFYIGTLSDRIFAPFWPPNIILFFALLLVPERRWWLYIAAAFPAHVAAEVGVGMPPAQYLVAFATNCAVATLGAYGVRRFIGHANWLGTLRRAATYVLITVIVCPALAALGGAFVPLLSDDGGITSYWVSWAHWYSANALASATLGPALLAWYGGQLQFTRLRKGRQVEAVILLLVLIGVCTIAFGAGPRAVPRGFGPTLLYLPVPVVLWAAFRFGNGGASAAVLVVTIVSIWRNLHGSTVFDAGSMEQNVLALQVFLTAFSIPVLLLGATIEELRRAENRTRALAGSLLQVQDEERRQIASKLHDRMGQDLAGASLIVSRLQKNVSPSEQEPIRELAGILQHSVREVRTISYLLHPLLLDEAGLGLALRSYVNGFSERSGIAVDLSLPPTMERLPGDVELALFRVVQEALTNVYRHSGSASARIHLTIQDASDAQEVLLKVEDFGRGIGDSPHWSALTGRIGRLCDSPGLGLAGMRERLRRIGGEFSIESVTGRTVVTATVPLAARRDA